jgi:hypothetical protein
MLSGEKGRTKVSKEKEKENVSDSKIRGILFDVEISSKTNSI